MSLEDSRQTQLVQKEGDTVKELATTSHEGLTNQDSEEKTWKVHIWKASVREKGWLCSMWHGTQNLYQRVEARGKSILNHSEEEVSNI